MKTRLLFSLLVLLSFLATGTFAQAPNISYSTPSAYTVGTAITPLLPSNTGGAVPAAIYSNVTTLPLSLGLNNPQGLTTDGSGNIYVADYTSNKILKVTSSGTVSVIAGSGANAVLDGTGTAAKFSRPSGIVYVAGNLYVTDYIGNTVRQIVLSTLAVTTIAGSGAFAELPGTGLAAKFKGPQGITSDGSGNLYVADYDGNTIRKITIPGAVVSTIAGTGGANEVDNASGLSAKFNNPIGVVYTPGYLYVTDNTGCTVRQVSLTAPNAVTTIAGNGGAGADLDNATGILAKVSGPAGIVYDGVGNLYVCDNNNASNSVRVISLTAPYAVTTLAGDGTKAEVDGIGLAAEFFKPYGIAIDNLGSLFVGDNNGTSSTLRKVALSGYSISPALPAGLAFDNTNGQISGNPTVSSPITVYTVTAHNLMGSATTTVTISCIFPAPVISYSPSTNSYLVGTAITALTPTNTGGAVSALSFGTGTVFTGGGLAGPYGMTADASGYSYVADFTNGRVRKYNPDGTYTGTNFINSVTSPAGIVFDSAGNFYVSDFGDSKVYKYDATGSNASKTTFASGYTNARGLAIDASNNIYVADAGANTVTKYNSAGAVLLTLSANLSFPNAVAIDPSGYIYVSNKTSGNVVKFNADGSNPTLFLSGFTNPFGVAADFAGNIYVIDNGNNTVNVYNSTGTLLTSIGGFNKPQGVTVDSKGYLYIADFGAHTVTKYPPLNGYYLSGPLPPGLIFNSANGSFSGTPTKSFPATTYTVTAYSGGTPGSTTVTISCYKIHDWRGASADWNSVANWSSGEVPASSDRVRIGVAQSFATTPVLSASASAGEIVIGNTGGNAVGITVNSGVTLTVNGDITVQADGGSNLNYTHALSGSGTITANNLFIKSDFSISGQPYTGTISSSLAYLNIKNIKLASAVTTDVYNAAFNITGGITAVSGTIQTANASGSMSTVSVTNGTLQLSNAAALSGLSSTGTNIISFNNAGAIIEYSGAAQTIYTDGAITGLPGGVSYQAIRFSGTGVKAASSGNLNIAGDFKNSLANDASNYVNLAGPAVNFNGISQSLDGGSGNGTKFYKVTFSGAGTKFMSGGNFHVASSGVLTMSGNDPATILDAGGLLTLNSDNTGSASIAAINGPQIIGNVNVQRFVTGGAGYRGYRFMSSPVYTLAGTKKVYSINYLKNSSFLTGTGGINGGLDKAGNPTLYLYREDVPSSNASFVSGNFRGIYEISNPPNYIIDGDGGPYNIPVGAGYLFFFRGDRNAAGENVGTETLTGYVPTNTTLTATGQINQGDIDVTKWYNGSTDLTATNTGYTLVGNPYPCAIDLNTIGTDGTTGITGTHIFPFVWIFNPIIHQYGIYDLNIHMPLNGVSNVIASGQSFFIKSDNVGPAAFKITEAAKVTSVAQTSGVNLMMGNAKGRYDDRKLLRLQLYIDSVNYDDIAIAFNDNATSKYYNWEDSQYMTGINAAEGLASFSTDSVPVPLSINFLPLPKKSQQIIRLKVDATNTGKLTLKRTQLDSLPKIYEVWLVDRYKKDSLDLRNNDSYAFEVDKNDTATYGNQRFRIVIRQNKNLKVHLLDFAGSKKTDEVPLVWKTENEDNYTNFTVERSTDNGVTFNILGGRASNSQGVYTFDDKNPVKTVDIYRLKLEDLDGDITYSKWITVVYDPSKVITAKTKINVYPNPSKGAINIAISQPGFAAGPGGPLGSNPYPAQTAVYAIKIVSVNGSVIKSATSSSPDWQDNVSDLAPGTYFIQVTNRSDNSFVGKSSFVKL